MDYIIIRNLIITILVVSVPVSLIFLLRKREVKKAENVPIQLRERLAAGGVREAYGYDRFKYAVNVIAKGALLYGIILVGIAFEGIDISKDYKAFLLVFAVIAIFLLKDLWCVMPWKRVCRIKACKCFSGAHGEAVVCYFDFIKGICEAQRLQSFRLITAEDGKLFEALAVVGKNKIKVISVFDD